MKQKFSGYKVAIGCGIVIFFHLGCCYIWSVMLPYFLEVFQCSLALLSASSSLGTLIGFGAALSAGAVIGKLQPRKTLMLATCIDVVFMLISAFASAPWMLYVANGISGFVLAYGAQVTCAAIINRWFIHKRGVVIGTVFGMAAVGGSLYMFLAGQMIGIVGQKMTYLILGGIMAVACFFSENFLIKDSPEEVGEKPLGWEESQETEAVRIADDSNELTPAQARKSRSFGLLIVSIFLAAMLLATFSSFATTFWTANGISQATAATYASAMTLLGGFVSIAVGAIADKWGMKAFVVAIFGFFAVGVVFAILWGTVMPYTIMIVLNIVFVSAGTSTQSIGSTLVLPIFGSKAADSVNGTAMAFNYAGSALAIVAFSALYDLLGSFIPVFLILLILTFISLALILMALKYAPKKQVV